MGPVYGNRRFRGFGGVQVVDGCLPSSVLLEGLFTGSTVTTGPMKGSIGHFRSLEVEGH